MYTSVNDGGKHHHHHHHVNTTERVIVCIGLLAGIGLILGLGLGLGLKSSSSSPTPIPIFIPGVNSTESLYAQLASNYLPIPVFWYGADILLASSKTNDSLVGLWPDVTIHDNDAISANRSHRPTFELNAINQAYPGIIFAGNQIMTTPSVFPNGSDYTIITVFTATKAASGLLMGSNKTQNLIFLDNGIWIYHQGFQGGNYESQITFPINFVFVVTITFQNSTGNVNITTGGNVFERFLGSSGYIGAVTDTTCTLGSDPGFGNPFYGTIESFALWNSILPRSNQTWFEEHLLAQGGPNILYPQTCFHPDFSVHC